MLLSGEQDRAEGAQFFAELCKGCERERGRLKSVLVPPECQLRRRRRRQLELPRVTHLTAGWYANTLQRLSLFARFVRRSARIRRKKQYERKSKRKRRGKKTKHFRYDECQLVCCLFFVEGVQRGLATLIDWLTSLPTCAHLLHSTHIDKSKLIVVCDLSTFWTMHIVCCAAAAQERERQREREKFSNKRERNLICPISLARSRSRSHSLSPLSLSPLPA